MIAQDRLDAMGAFGQPTRAPAEETRRLVGDSLDGMAEASGGLAERVIGLERPVDPSRAAKRAAGFVPKDRSDLIDRTSARGVDPGRLDEVVESAPGSPQALQIAELQQPIQRLPVRPRARVR